MSKIVLVGRGSSEVAPLIARLKAMTGLPIHEVRRRLDAGTELVTSKLFRNDHDEVAGRLRAVVSALREHGVSFSIYELEEGELLSDVELSRCAIDVATLESILRLHTLEVERQRRQADSGREGRSR